MNSRSFLRESVLLLMLLMAYVSVWSQGGNNCATAGSSPVALPFFTNNQTLCGALNDYTGTNSCLSNLVNGSPFGGQDWLYAVTPTQSGFLSIVLNDIHATGSVRPIIAVFEGCAGVGPCVTTIQGNVNNGVSTIVPVVAGLTYYIVVDASSSTNNNAANCYQYDLALNLSPNAVQPSCSNMGFESGNFSSWVTTTGNSVTAAVGAPTPIYQLTGLGVVNGRHTIMTGGTDPCGGFSCVDPLGGTSSVRIGNSNTGAEAEMISQTFIVSQSNSSFTYRYAVVFEDPGHTSAEQPFFIARLRAQDGTVIPCSEFIVSAAADLPGFFNSLTCAGVRYKPWSTVNVDLSNYLGQNVTVEFTAGDCSQGGHFGYAYVDASCAPSTLAALADTICPGQSVTLTAPSGYESFNWMPGNLTSQTITVSPAVSTTYTLNLTAFNGCVSAVQVPITIAPIPVPVIQYQAPACDLPVQVQSASTIASGSITSQQWSFAPSGTPGTSAQPVVNVVYLGPGSYPVSLQVTSDQGCTASATQSVVVPPCVFHIAISGDTICPGECLTFPVALSFGVAPYSYSWSTGSTASSITLCSNQSNIISLTVTDATGAVATDTAMVTVVPSITFQPSITNVLCNGGATASINPGAQGWGPFAYSWSNASTATSLSSIAAGNYSVTVTDNFGCPGDTTFLISQPAVLTTTLTIQPATCAQSNGVITVNPPSGGTAPYEFAIDGGVYSSFAQFTGLTVGTHSISVRDANGCLFSVSGTINMLSYPTQLSMQLTDATCGLDNGVIAPLQVTGGVGPFQLWVNGANMGIVAIPISFSNLPAGPFNVELTDANGCMIDTNVTLQQLASPASMSITIQPATCGLSNASLSIGAITGGNPGYLYSINGGAFGSQTTFSQLTPGTFTLIVQDQHQCQLDTLISVTAIPDVEVAAVLLQNAQCYGSNDGQAAAQIVSGTAPYTYLWTNSDSDSLATTLQAGSWNVYVTDAQNCKDTATVVITEPALLDMSLSYINPRCALTNGQISVASLSGGTAPYHYQLNGGVLQGTSTFSLLDVGSYTLQAVDAHGCSVARQAQLAMPSYPTNMTLQKQDAVCGLPNGIARLMQIQGGVAPYQVQWLDTNFQFIQQLPFVLENLAAGSYPIQIRDANGCLVDSASTILQLLGPSQMQVQVQPATCATSNAQIQLMNVVGGSPSYTYSFNNGTYGNQQVFSNLGAGQYTLSVRDMNGCAIDSIIPVTAIPTVQAEPFITHPITCYGFSDGALQLDIQQGTAPYTVNWLNGPTGIASNNLVAGYYQVTITDGQGCTQTTGIQLNQPDPVVVHVTGPAYVCENEEAQLIASASGGTSHVNVTWPEFSVDGDTLIHHPTSTRVYTAIATDILGCAASDSHTVMLRLRPQGNISTSVAEGCSPVCANFTVNSTGTSTLAAFSWNFSNGETSSNQQQQICFTEGGLQDASVILVDEYGCTNTLTAEGIVNVFPLPDARFSYNPNTADIVQPEYQFIQESLLASTFQWTFGDGQTSTLASPLHTFPDTGSFTACLRVTSIHGCVDQVCKKVEIDPFPTIYAPNAFTPNGDGTNEVFMIKVTYADKFFLEIFNRWGELIYQGSDPLEGWDGTYKGNRCQEDVYVWRATISNSEKLNKQMIGRVSLID